MKSIFSVLCLVVLLGCASKEPPRPLDLPFSQFFNAPYDEVWNAAVNVLDLYSITEASRESGVLKTDFSNFNFNRGLYDLPKEEDRLDQVRYRIEVKLSKGVVSQTGQTAVRVQILKKRERYKNLLTDWERIPTDTLEERVLLYRIGQRLRVGAELKRSRLKGSKRAG